jgi:hypothetical protein
MHNLYLRDTPNHKYLVYRAGYWHPVRAFYDRLKARDWCINQSRRTGVEYSYMEK